MKPIAILSVVLCLLLVNACSNNSDITYSNNSGTTNTDTTNSETQRLLERFGHLQPYFTEAGVQGLLDYEDTGRPVTLLQLMSITDIDAFTRYEEEVAALWESVGASERFRSEVFGQLVGDRSMEQIRAIEFPNMTVLVSAMETPAFTDLMNTLAAASDDHAWVLGEEVLLPFTPGGSYVDTALQNLDSDEALAILAAANDNTESVENPAFQSNMATVIDMVVSDAPSPFYMVNLVDFYEEANFPDGRDTDLSGEEANEIYGNTILPTLLAHNSQPYIAMPVAIILTDDEVEWEQAAIMRYASRDAFLNVFALNPQADEATVYKKAGVENTLVYASEVPGTVLPAP